MTTSLEVKSAGPLENDVEEESEDDDGDDVESDEDDGVGDNDEYLDNGDDADDEDADEDAAKLHGFAGMGDVIGKILEKELDTKGSGNVVLCASKKSRKRKLDAKAEHAARQEKEKKLAESRELNHVVPTRGNAHKEAALKRVATRGVVKLLNAVSQHQKNVSAKMKEERTEAGKDRVESKVTKPSNFMELLNKKKKPEAAAEGKKKKKKGKEELLKEEEIKTEDEEDEEEGGGKWKVLREDFMLGSSMKDWDKNDDSGDDDGGEGEEGADDTSSDDENG